MALSGAGAAAAEIEDIHSAVRNMGLGWNLGNTLDAHSGDTLNMWIEHWGSTRTFADYETAWGQPVTKPAVFRMLKEAGFNAVRIPVTWYPHMEAKFRFTSPSNSYWYPSKDDIGTKIQKAWMARVKQLVDYALDAGLYCIINVHHDTGAANTAWLIADEKVYERECARFEAIWTQIAEEFRNYDGRLLFEGYNEMLDPYRSWCYASMNTASKYDYKVSASAYNAINRYAQSFVNAVRATGGNNLTRNLIVTTYGACSGAGSWNDHLTDPLSKMKLPEDISEGHIAFEIHTYPDVSSIDNCKNEVSVMISRLKRYLGDKAPVIIGEWGCADVDDPKASIPMRNRIAFIEHLVKKSRDAGFAVFYWMGLTDGADRNVPKWTEPELMKAMVEAWYDGPYDSVPAIEAGPDDTEPCYDLLGRRAELPLRPGIYIRGGKKFVVSK